ncbi:MAG: endonuclease/exonuclease/phosphatase family metal-dependent hydrolase [Marinoscillum sp.]|jgi:endonuclease/exonuclease/phosphatase family metal-dependent hydrolase
MRIFSWNCNGALRKKFHQIEPFDADIVIIQECEDPNQSKDEEYKKWANNHLWIGDNKNKGLSVFAKSTIQLDSLKWSNLYRGHPVKYFLPCLIDKKIQLLAVWAHQNKSPTFGYIGQIWKYLQINKNHFKDIIIAGDFNSNAILDKWDRWWNHTDVTKELAQASVKSAYHELKGEEQGKESNATFFLQRNLTKSYHIDYIYLNTRLLTPKATLNIGEQSKWIEISDHLPLILET